MSAAVWLALTLSAAAPSETACVVEAVVEAVEPHDAIQGIERDRLVLSGARAFGCTPPATVVVASDRSPLFVVGTPSWQPGATYRFEIAPTTQPNLSAVVLRDGGAAVEPVAPPTGELWKSGNNQPPCAQADLRWPVDEIELEAELASVGSFDAARVEAAWRAAVDAWSAETCSGATLTLVEGAADADWGLRADGRSTVAFERSDSSIFSELGLADGLGFTCWVCNDEGQIIESDVRFDGARVAWEDDCDADAYDAMAVALHEFGHVLGLSHDDDPRSVMYAVTSPRRLLDARRPNDSDRGVLCGRYPCDGVCDDVPVAAWPDCPSGAPICASCEADEECGASTDRCLRAVDGDERICSRACSASYPCPDGHSCLVVGDGVRQCVPDGDTCTDRAFVGAPCAVDADCGVAGDRCLEDGTCGASCEELACPNGSVCELASAPAPLVVDEQCVSEGLPSGKGGDKGGRCSAAPDAGGAAFLWLLILALRRRCVLERSRRPSLRSRSSR